MTNFYPNNFNFIGNQHMPKVMMGKHLLDGVIPIDTGESHLFPQIFVYSFDARQEPNTQTKIKIYISDFYDSAYILDKELYFDVRVEIDRKVEIHRDIRGGDYTVDFGILPEGEHVISFQVIDKLGRKSQRIFYEILIRSSFIAPEDIYTATLKDLKSYNITLGLTYDTATETLMKNNRLGLNNLLNDRAKEGYKKLILVNGTYRIMHSNRDKIEPDNPYLSLPSDFTLDLNGATLKLHPYLDKITKAPNIVARFDHCFDSHIINGTLEGDWDERQKFKSQFGSYEGEGAFNIGFYGNSKYCALKNVTIKNVTGYNIYSGVKDATLVGMGKWTDNKSIDEKTGNEIDSQGHTSTGHIDISKLLSNGFVACNYWLGYGGLVGIQPDIWLSFYDENYNFIEQIQVYQHRRCQIPLNSKFTKITIRGTASEATRLTLHNHMTPKGTALIDCHWDRNRTCAAPAQFQHFTMKNCTFFESGHSITPCAIDLEDGWEQMQDFFMIDCEIQAKSGTADLITNSGYNHHMTGNKGWRFILRGGLRGYTVEGNSDSSVNTISTQKNSFSTRIYNNDMNGMGFGTHNLEYPQILKNKTLNIDHTNTGATAIIGGTFGIGWHSNLNLTGVTVYKNAHGNYYNDGNNHFRCCRFIGTEKHPTYTIHFNTGSSKNLCTWTDCTFIAPTHMRNHNYFSLGLWSDCTFKDTVKIEPNPNTIMGNVKFENCVFEKLVTYNTNKIQFNNCVFKQGLKCTGKSKAQFNNCIGV